MRISELFKVEGYGVVVTGGASGIGLAYAEALAENGARVTILDIDAQAIERQSQRLMDLGYSVRGEVVDVRDSGAIDSAFDAALRAHERLDVVFANAGIDSRPRFFGELDRDRRAAKSGGLPWKTIATSAGTGSLKPTSTRCSPHCVRERDSCRHRDPAA